MNPTILGFIGPGFLNQVPTLKGSGSSAEAIGGTALELTTSL